MLQALRRLVVALAIASGLSITAMALSAPGAYAAALVHLADDDDDDRPKGGVDTGLGGVSRDDDDDDRPKGGVDTGLGGAEVRLSAAAGGGLPVVPLALAGGGVLLAGAYGVSRKLGRR
jgi:hypothetical protein